MSNTKRKIEIFSAGCPVCKSVVEEVMKAVCSSCDIQVLDMKSPDVQQRASELDIKSVPAVTIDGKLADCCSSRGVDMTILQGAGLGQSLG
jgi:glutaredoxin 3